MHQRQRRLHGRVAQIREILRQLHGQQHALVDDGLVRQAAEVPVLGAIERRSADLAVGALASHIKATLELQIIFDFIGTTDEHLTHEGFAALGGLAEHRVVDRNRTPAEHGQPGGLNDVLEGLLELATLGGIARQEHYAGAELTRLRERKARLFAGFFKEGMRHLQQHAGAVARIDLTAAGAAMIEILEHLDRLLQDLVGFTALDIDDKTDAAGVFLKTWVV